MARGEGTGGLYSLRYLSSVAVATLALAMVAWIAQDRQLALAAGVMGLYALHLISIRYILDNQQQHTLALQSQWELLQRLVDPDEPADRITREADSPHNSVEGVEPVPGIRAEPLDVLDPRANITGEAPPAEWSREPDSMDGEPRSWPPIGLPLSTIDSAPDLAIPPGLDMPDLPALGVSATGLTNGDKFIVSEVPIPRHFALGTVALIRQLLTPQEVARVLMEQRRQPDKRFATLAVEMGLLEDSQREELLLAQQEGLFTEEEMRQAREGLHQFRESTAKALSDLD